MNTLPLEVALLPFKGRRPEKLGERAALLKLRVPLLNSFEGENKPVFELALKTVGPRCSGLLLPNEYHIEPNHYWLREDVAIAELAGLVDLCERNYSSVVKNGAFRVAAKHVARCRGSGMGTRAARYESLIENIKTKKIEFKLTKA